MPDKIQSSIRTIEYAQPPARKASEYLDAYKSWVYPATMLIAQDTAAIPLRLFKHLDNGDVEEVADHDALSVIKLANPFQTEQQLREASIAYKYLLGEFAWLIVRSNDKPIEVHCLRPDYITVKPDGRGGVEYYEYKPEGNGAVLQIEPRNLLMYRAFNPKNIYRGYGVVQAAALDIDIDEFSDEWNRNFFFNSAMPSMIISTDSKVDKASKKRFVEKFQGSHGGVRNAHKTAFMDGGKLNVEKLSTSMQELDFQTSKERLRDKILATFLLSKANIGLTDDVNKANALAQERRYKVSIIRPQMVAFVGFLNEFYLPLWDDTEDYFFNFEDPVTEDQEVKLEIYKVASQLGWISVNEARQDLLGLDPVKGGDTIYRPYSLQPIDSPIPGQDSEDNTEDDPEDDTEKPEESKGFFARMFTKKTKPSVQVLKVPKRSSRLIDTFKFGAPIRPRNPKRQNLRRLQETIKTDMKKLIVSLMRQSEMKKGEAVLKSDNYEESTAIWKEFIEQANVYENTMRKIVQELSVHQQHLVVSELTERRRAINDGKFKRPGAVLFNLKEEADRWRHKIRPFLAQVIEQQANTTLAELALKSETSIDMSREDVDEFLTLVLHWWVYEVCEYTRQLLEETIMEGIENGESYDEIIQRVVAVFEELRTTRADLIAELEIGRAMSFAAFTAYIISGVVVDKEWITQRDSRVRHDHKEMDSVRVPLLEPFDVGGSSMMYPRDPNGPAEQTIGCRCFMRPITIFQREVNNILEKHKKEAKIKQVMEAVSKRIVEYELQKQQERAELLKQSNADLEKMVEIKKQELLQQTTQLIEDDARAKMARKQEEIEQEAISAKSLVKHEIDTLESRKTAIEKTLDHASQQLRQIEEKSLLQMNATRDSLDDLRRKGRQSNGKEIARHKKILEKGIEQLTESFKNKRSELDQLDVKIQEKGSILDKAKEEASRIIESAKKTASDYKTGAIQEFNLLRDRIENVIKRKDRDNKE